ncbi:MAG: restriction endonuclease subunit S, partial [Tissierellia bacterium]|nr:restriction endonuclease subunit S [Tissierellia bacterium]
MYKVLDLIQEDIEKGRVEWKRLGDVCESIRTGLNPRKNFKLNDFSGEEPNCWYVTTKDYSINEKIEIIPGKTAKITQEAKNIINKRSKLEKGDLLFSAVGTVGKIAIVDVDPYNFDVNESTFVLKVKSNVVNNKYLLYFLRSDIFQYNMQNYLKGSTLSGIRKKDLVNFKIPIPPLKTQEKIVETLDTFTNYTTALQTELETELEKRSKQYEYYRDRLLSEEYLKEWTESIFEILDKEVKTVNLGEIGKFTRGNGLQKKDFIKDGKPVIHYGQIYTSYGFSADETISYTSDLIFNKLRKANKNDLLIATTSENIEDVGKCLVWEGEEIGFSGDMYSYRTEQNPRFIAYFLQTRDFHKQKEKFVTGTKIIRLHENEFKKVKMLIPSLPIQQKIVEILDRFQALAE